MTSHGPIEEPGGASPRDVLLAAIGAAPRFAGGGANLTAGTTEPPERDTAPVLVLADKRTERARKKTAARGSGAGIEGALTDERGQILPILANVMIPLRAAPEISEAFSFDEMLRATVLDKPLPLVEGASGIAARSLPRPLQDEDVSQVQEWLQHFGLSKIGRDTVHQAIHLRAQERAFHPIRDYLDSLVWDGKPRIDRWLTYHLGVEPSPYAARVGRMFLISMVARIFRPGCKVDYAIVLEGPQGARKSTACATLAGKWFSDSLPEVAHDKDVAQHLRGKWLIEISELSSMRRSESEVLKAFISRPVERYRPPYGREEVSEARQCVFIGTTNNETYLRDETGGRRFWPVLCGSIDTDALEHDRDQLFAEAVNCFHAGAKWWPDDDFEREHVKPQQERRLERDPWEEEIRKYVEPLKREREPKKRRVNVTDIARNCLYIDVGRIGTADARRIAGVLRTLKWRAGRDADGRYYEPPNGAGDDA